VVRHSPVLLTAIVAIAGGCSGGRSSAGFHLPPGGNAADGKTAFVTLGCPACHSISGLDLPRPAAPSPVPVVLGGTVNHLPGDGQMVTSIIYPSYQLARYPARDIPASGHSRMPHYADRMTVRQLTDIVAFLQAQYTARPPAPLTPY
jgi:L-cysteine S-thiosulfotransferase